MLASSSTQHSLPPPCAACSVKRSLADSNVASKISADDAAKVEEEVEAALRWVQTNQVSRPGLLSLLVDGRFGHCFGVVEQCSEQGAGCSATLKKSTSPSCQQLSSTLPVQLMPAEKYEERNKQVEGVAAPIFSSLYGAAGAAGAADGGMGGMGGMGDLGGMGAAMGGMGGMGGIGGACWSFGIGGSRAGVRHACCDTLADVHRVLLGGMDQSAALCHDISC